MLENKLGLTSSAELARMEEQLSKKKAVLLFEKGILDSLPADSQGKYGKRKFSFCTADVFRCST